MSIILTQHNLVVAFHCTGKKYTRSLSGLDARTSPEVLTPKGVTMASRTATNALIHAGGSPTAVAG